MPKTTAEKIATKREQIRQLQNEGKQLIQKRKKEERAARTRRFCSRYGLFSVLQYLVRNHAEVFQRGSLRLFAVHKLCFVISPQIDVQIYRRL